MDHSCYLSSPMALDFYRRLGGLSAIQAYTKPLLDWAQQMLCHALNTPVLPVPPSMQVSQDTASMYTIYGNFNSRVA